MRAPENATSVEAVSLFSSCDQRLPLWCLDGICCLTPGSDSSFHRCTCHTPTAAAKLNTEFEWSFYINVEQVECHKCCGIIMCMNINCECVKHSHQTLVTSLNPLATRNGWNEGLFKNPSHNFQLAAWRGGGLGKKKACLNISKRILFFSYCSLWSKRYAHQDNSLFAPWHLCL